MVLFFLQKKRKMMVHLFCQNIEISIWHSICNVFSGGEERENFQVGRGVKFYKTVKVFKVFYHGRDKRSV